MKKGYKPPIPKHGPYVGPKKLAKTREAFNPDAPIKKKKKKRNKESVAQVLVETADNFKNQYESIRKLVGSEAEDFKNDKASIAMYRAMLTSTIALIPLAEKEYKKTKNAHASYAFSGLITQARELANDIRNLEDLEEQVDHIKEFIIQPCFTLIIQQLINVVYEKRTDLISSAKNPKFQRKIHRTFDELLKDQGKYLNDMVDNIDSRLKTYMLEK